ncbi:M61 family metallopeptidase [Aestuariibacter salexigens]|uniref:M61 family metallopeptidase n=1 Tax=Aestuariibacter salexigens TaxID=226010 RepID=UPI00047A2200|nr:PDZ domain-containing protein [Aestuariibacter salexigens]
MTETIHYSVTPVSIAEHLVEVRLALPVSEKQGHTLSLPAWIPGSYMIRDFARHIITFTVTDSDGHRVEWKKTDKQTWQIAPHHSPLTVTYQVYAFDLSVRSAYLCDDYCFFNGTSMFLHVEGLQHEPCKVRFARGCCPDSWHVFTTLCEQAASASYDFVEYTAADYDELIDHPVLFTDAKQHAFHIDGIDFELIFCGGHQADVGRITLDVKTICEHHLTFFGSKPDIDRYLFMTLLSDNGYGGLEHRSSTALMFPRLELPGPQHVNEMTDGYASFLGLCSHEFFHTWHVKRIRPSALQHANLQQEVYTPQLWIYEGFTSYYDDLSLVRCGVISADKYLELLGQNLTRVLRNQGRFKQSIAESSFDAWTKFYKQDASAINNIVSYYTKGAIVALGLDLLIRQQSNHVYSLDTIMRMLWERYGQHNIGTSDDVINTLCAELLGVNVDGYIQTAVYGSEDVPIGDLLEHVGIRHHLRARNSASDKGGKASEKVFNRDFGAIFSGKETGVVLNQIIENSPIATAGAMIGDLLIAIDDWQVTATNLYDVLQRLPENQSVSLLVLRQGRVKHLNMIVSPAVQDTVYLSIQDQQKAQRWLTPQQ